MVLLQIEHTAVLLHHLETLAAPTEDLLLVAHLADLIEAQEVLLLEAIEALVLVVLVDHTEVLVVAQEVAHHLALEVDASKTNNTQTLKFYTNEKLL